MNKNEEIEKLEKETIEAGFNLSYVEEFINLKSKYKFDQVLKKECDYNIALIYSNNGQIEKALAIFSGLIKDKEFLSPNKYAIIILYSIDHLTQLNRLEQAKIVFEENIHSKELKAFNLRLTLLTWFVEKFNPSNAELLQYKDIFNSAIRDLGYLPKETELQKQITEANSIQKLTARNYGEVNISLEGKSTIEKIEIMKKFISSDPPEFFRNLAEKLLSQIEIK